MGTPHGQGRYAALRLAVAGLRPVQLSILLAVMLLVWCPGAYALDPALDVSQYAHTTWKFRDGITKGAVFSIAQTPDGYLWLGTEFGLVRFDGTRAVPWQPPENQRLPSGPIYALLVCRDGTLWIGTWTGLASWKDGKLTGYPGLDGETVFNLLEDRSGTVWVGAGGTPLAGKLCSIRGGSVDCFGGDGRLGQAVLGLLEDRNGNIWVGLRDGLWKWKPGPPKFYSLPGQPSGIRALGEDSSGALLIGWSGGISRFVNGKIESYPLPGVTRRFRANRILRDRDGSLWIGTVESGIVHIHEGRADVFSTVDGLSGDNTYPQFEDREGNIWLSTVEGIDRFRCLAVATLTKKQGLSTALVGSILSDKNGSVWLATYGGLNRWDHGQISTPSTGGAKKEGKLDGSNPNSLFQDSRGRIWVSTLSELGYLENGRFVTIQGVPDGSILSIAQDAGGNVWVINERAGLFRISPQNDVRQILWADLGHRDHASVLAADRRQGGLWIGFYSGGISYFSEGQIRASYTASQGLGEGFVGGFQF